MRKWTIISILIILFFVQIPNLSYADFSHGYPPDEEIEVSPEGPVSMQTLKATVKGISQPRPKVVWVQSDTDIWSATFDDGTRIVTGTLGSGASAYPLYQRTDFTLNVEQYAPSTMRDSLDNPFQKEFIRELGIEDMEWKDEPSYDAVDDKPEFVVGNMDAIIRVYTGNEKRENDKIAYGTRPDRSPKFTVHYFLPMLIKYSGYVVEKKQMRVLENATLAVNETKNMQAQVRTLKYNMTDFPDNWNTVTNETETTWSTDRASVATVDSTGKVKGVGVGTAKITAKWKKGPYWLYASATITVGDGGTTDPPGGTGSCTWTIEPPRQVAAPQTISMDPRATGVIKADDASNSPHNFDVGQGIPTSDYLYANTLGLNYLFQHTFGNQVGKIKYNCNVNLVYALTWKERQPSLPGPNGTTIPQPDIPKSATEPKTYMFSFTRDYDYWTIKNLEVYTLNKSTMSNYALPSGTVTLNPTGYVPPTLETKQSDPVGDHVYPKETGTISFTPPIQDGGYSRPSPDDHSGLLLGMAESQTQDAEVQNDKVNFNGEIIMKDDKATKKAPTPGKIPESPMMGNRVLYLGNQLISRTLVNKANTPSSGTIFYDLLGGHVGGSGGENYAISHINTVTVHTPVVNYSSVTDDKEHNQKTTPNANRAAFILDRPFTVRIPTAGQHVPYPGYGNRDYAKYIMTKQVYFPFDVYQAGGTQFIPKNTWIDVPIHQLDTSFFLPVWVDEGDYTVYFRTIAENSPVKLDTEPDANRDLVNHVATDTVSVEVIGRLYDFHVTDIADYNWETVFRTKKGSSTPSGFSYWVGDKSIDGAPRGNAVPYVLPVAQGKHPSPSYTNVAVKTGYHFKFDFKTKGNMFRTQDGIAITPSFYYVSKDGKSRQAVDLYYNSGSKTMIKLGSAQDTERRYVILNDRLRNVAEEELKDTAAYLYNHEESARKVGTLEQFTKKYMENLSQQKTWVGRYNDLTLPSAVRTLMGPKYNIPSSVDIERANAAIQHWYGEYSIPADIYAVKKGTNVAEYGRTHTLDDHAPIFMKQGYMIVNFDIETLQNGDVIHPHLQYIHAPLMNQWQMEGFSRTYTDPKKQLFSLMDGDVIFYHANLSSRDDFRSQVTH
ncbi:hypothetical protein J2T13_000426 [Paenibacillus sp. DS2015]|uniref:DUF5704 domain-containing protein n=1 Tax=Paenibacillus sp. DS2015 TaxID=3373917 RepID=UPI003D1C0698